MERKRSSTNPVWRHTFSQLTWANGESDAQSVACPFNGVVYNFITTVNNNDNNRAVTVGFTTSGSKNIYTSGAIAENATTSTRLTAGTEIYVPDGCTMVVTPSGDPGASGLTADIEVIGI